MKKQNKRLNTFIALLLMLVTMTAIFSISVAALSTKWDVKAVEKISQTDAQIKARVNFSEKVKCTQAGFYFGSSKDNLKKNSKYDSISYTGKYLDMWFLMSKYGQKLKADTTYYYKFYVIAQGKTYYSSVMSFKTLPNTASSLKTTWDIKAVEKLSKTDAQIKARANFSKSVKCTQAGFYFGTDKDNLKKNSKYDSINYTGKYLDMWFLMSKYGQTLKAGTTYYYKFYVIADGKTYYSDIKSFTTKPDETTTQKPTTPDLKTWWEIGVDDITNNSATIKMVVSVSDWVSFTESGFYIGTSESNMVKKTKQFSSGVTDTILSSNFKTSDYGVTLNFGTKYYYKAYVVADGKIYYSNVDSFTTKNEIEGKPTDQISHSYTVSASEITYDNAKISSKVTFSRNVKIAEKGLYIGTAKNALDKCCSEAISATGNSLSFTYDVSKYCKLKANTTYYYQTYVVANGKVIYSPEKSFTTAKNTALVWPVKDSNSITQGFHKGSIDIGGSGKNIIAAMGGTVYKIYTCTQNHYESGKYGDCGGFGTGLIIKGDDNRYYWYAHMKAKSIPSGIKKGSYIKQGQSIGKVGNTGYSAGAHLHFGIATNSDIYTKKYWVDPISEVYSDKKLSYFKNISTSNISSTDAKISATTIKTSFDSVGFYIGTNKTSMKRYNEKASGLVSNIYYQMSKWYGKLKANTTYYYKFYVVVNGKEICSDIKSFKTTNASSTVNSSWSVKSIEKLSKTDAQIKARVNFSKSVKCTQAGFYFGTSKNNLKKNAKYDSISHKGTYLDMWFLMSKYGQKLKAGTTYYYKFYVVADGKTYYSEVKSFTTKSK